MCVVAAALIAVHEQAVLVLKWSEPVTLVRRYGPI